MAAPIYNLEKSADASRLTINGREVNAADIKPVYHHDKKTVAIKSETIQLEDIPATNWNQFLDGATAFANFEAVISFFQTISFAPTSSGVTGSGTASASNQLATNSKLDQLIAENDNPAIVTLLTDLKATSATDSTAITNILTQLQASGVDIGQIETAIMADASAQAAANADIKGALDLLKDQNLAESVKLLGKQDIIITELEKHTALLQNIKGAAVEQLDVTLIADTWTPITASKDIIEIGKAIVNNAEIDVEARNITGPTAEVRYSANITGKLNVFIKL